MVQGSHGLNLANLRELPIALPPIVEQQRIVAEVERRLSVVAANEKVNSRQPGPRRAPAPIHLAAGFQRAASQTSEV